MFTDTVKLKAHIESGKINSRGTYCTHYRHNNHNLGRHAFRKELHCLSRSQKDWYRPAHIEWGGDGTQRTFDQVEERLRRFTPEAQEQFREAMSTLHMDGSPKVTIACAMPQSTGH